MKTILVLLVAFASVTVCFSQTPNNRHTPRGNNNYRVLTDEEKFKKDFESIDTTGLNDYASIYYYQDELNPGISFAGSFLVPGLGQFYNGDNTRGFIHFTIALISGLVLFLEYDDGDSNLEYAFGFYAVNWVFSIVDAPIKTQKINRQIRMKKALLRSKGYHVGLYNDGLSSGLRFSLSL